MLPTGTIDNSVIFRARLMPLWSGADERGRSPCAQYTISREGTMLTQVHIRTSMGRVLMGLAVLGCAITG